MTNLKRYFAIVILAAATPAAAGEVNGNGDPTPINSYRANSICSFSGLQDGNPPFPSTQVQNWGAIVASLRGLPPALPGPGVSCNGHSGVLS